MSKEIKTVLKETILEVLKEQKKSQINEFNAETGKFDDEGFSNKQKKLTSKKIAKFGDLQ